MRFQLDPRAKPPERAAPPPKAGPAAPTPAAPHAPAPAAPPLPAEAPAQPGEARSRTRLYAMLAVALLLTGGTATASLYALEMPPFEYPRRYLLEGGELPRDMILSDLPEDVQEEMGIRENPGQVDKEDLDVFAAGNRVPQPVDAWLEALSHRSVEAPIVVLALKFEDADDAERWAGAAALVRCSASTSVLRDEAVVVVVAAEDSEAQPYVGRVVNALLDEAPDLKTVCRR